MGACHKKSVDSPRPGGPVAKLIWDTDGGGQMHFEITAADSVYALQVASVHFQVCDTVLFLTSASPDVYNLVDDVFSGEVVLQAHDYSGDGETGTWTKIILIYETGRCDTLPMNPIIDSPLHAIAEWIGSPCD